MAKKKLKLATACVKDSGADLVFWLKNEQGNIRLMAKGKGDSFKWSILEVSAAGTVRKVQGVSDEIGLKVDQKGRIRTAPSIC